MRTARPAGATLPMDSAAGNAGRECRTGREEGVERGDVGIDAPMSSARAGLLDLDGTLVDANYRHAFAWYRAFRRFEKAGTRDAVMLGGSRWDIEAAAGAGLATICVITGGWSKQELRDHGAVGVYGSLPELRERLDERPLAQG
jgi:phosphoglycolate phosphatase-like HAD superfamily hydrolase